MTTPGENATTSVDIKMTSAIAPSNPPMSIVTEMNKLVYEYLEVTGMGETMLSFASECNLKAVPCLPPSKDPLIKLSFTPNDSVAMIESFDKGDMDTFLEKWNLFLSHIQITSEDMRKLDVYLRVYFANWPKAHNGSIDEHFQKMTWLRTYFEENSSELSKDPTLLPLFALPFVSDPKNHAVFKELFQPVWTERLRAQLESTVLKYFDLLQENIAHHSKLAALVIESKAWKGGKQINGGLESLVQYHRDRFYQLMTTYRKVRKLLRGTRESYGKLLKVSNELICGLEEGVNKPLKNVDPIIQKCHGIFPELFTSADAETNAKPDKEYFKKLASAAIFNNTLDSDVSLFFIGISDLGPESLNYPKIKKTLTSEIASQSEKLCLLQALRWLLTKSSPKCREHTIATFISADLLGLSEDKEYGNNLFAKMITPNPTYTKECFARLLNAFASIKSGRQYLSQNNHALDTLVQTLITCKSDSESYIAQMIIATLQKLSLKKKMRMGMIERKVIQWLAVYLKEELAKKHVPRFYDNGNFSYNPYLMEYGWALLMNLCLHEEAKPASLSIASDILSSVVQMLNAKPAPDVAPYVVSTLYSLLRNPDVFAAAKRMQLQGTLNEIIGKSPTEMAHHLKKLVEVLNKKNCDRITTTGEVDYDDDDNGDPEEFEPELEVCESWVASLDSSNYTGDDLLIRQYLLHREIVLPQAPGRKNQSQPLGVYTRPTTPKVTDDSYYQYYNAKLARDDANAIVKNMNDGKPIAKNRKHSTNSKSSSPPPIYNRGKITTNQSAAMKKKSSILESEDKLKQHVNSLIKSVNKNQSVDTDTGLYFDDSSSIAPAFLPNSKFKKAASSSAQEKLQLSAKAALDELNNNIE